MNYSKNLKSGFTRTPKFGLTPKEGGFTLIELLVVVAIIGILASVVLASLNTARAKGGDAAVKANLANARAQAELFYDSNTNKYVVTAGGATDVCQSTASVGTPAIKGIYLNVLAAANAGGATSVVFNTLEIATTAACNSAASTWVAQAPLKTSGAGYWCVDWTGTSEVNASPLAAAATQCP